MFVFPFYIMTAPLNFCVKTRHDARMFRLLLFNDSTNCASLSSSSFIKQFTIRFLALFLLFFWGGMRSSFQFVRSKLRSSCLPLNGICVWRASCWCWSSPCQRTSVQICQHLMKILEWEFYYFHSPHVLDRLSIVSGHPIPILIIHSNSHSQVYNYIQILRVI